jgi:hypothetical protein
MLEKVGLVREAVHEPEQVFFSIVFNDIPVASANPVNIAFAIFKSEKRSNTAAALRKGAAFVFVREIMRGEERGVEQ